MERLKKLKDILATTFGHQEFRFNQQLIIESILDGIDTIAILPTGGGKSLCYQIPALYQDGVTIVVSPLISLMQDQVVNLDEYGVNSCFLNSTLSRDEWHENKEAIINGEIKLVYVSPEGLLSSHLLDFFDEIDISFFAIDEAHCVSQWGHEFRKDYIRLGELKKYYPDIPIMALTATADAKTRKDIASQLKMQAPQTFVSSFDRPNIKYSIYEREDELKQLQKFINENHDNECGIVYCLSRKKVEQIAKDLKRLGYNARPYHAGLTVKQRERTQKAFTRDGNIIIVATIAFGMGIDRPDVRFVAHLDLPKSIESYYQETGRAGRDGKESSAWMVYGLQDIIKLSGMLENTEASETYKKAARFKLDTMLTLCETIDCKRRYLLNYFEEELADDCGNCDSCLAPATSIDATEDAKKLLSTIYRTGEYFGAGHIIDVLRGSKNAKVLEKRHDKLSVYGIGKDKDKNHWNALARQLLGLGYLRIKSWDYRNLGLTNKCHEILKGENTFKMRQRDNVKLSKKRRVEKAAVSHENNDLFEELRELRRELSSEKNVPPYVIFPDKSLHDMCLLLPQDKSDFLLVNGVGMKKYESYGESFLRVIREFS